MENVKQTIISQYGNSPTLLALIHNMNDYIDQSINFQEFYDFVWNVDTAQGFGLDYWGKIVGVGRTIQLPLNGQYFGFKEPTNYYQPFGYWIFYSGQVNYGAQNLDDNAYRIVILAKALANISITSAASLNQILQNLFGTLGRAYVNDLGGMAMRITFEYAVDPVSLAIITQLGALPIPAGVSAYTFQMPYPTFGFQEPTNSYMPFGQGVFQTNEAFRAIN